MKRVSLTLTAGLSLPLDADAHEIEAAIRRAVSNVLTQAGIGADRFEVRVSEGLTTRLLAATERAIFRGPQERA